MATEKELRDRITQLQNSISSNKAEMERLLKRQEDAYQAELKRIHNEAMRRLELNNLHMRDEAQTIITKEFSRAAAANRAQIQAVRGEYERLHDQTAQWRQECDELLKKLHQRIDDYLESKAQYSAKEQQAAEDAINTATLECTDVDALPHEVLCPGRFSACAQELEQAQTLFQMKIFQAAAALALAGKFNLRLLSAEIGEIIDEWRSAYEVYKYAVESASEYDKKLLSEKAKEIGRSFNHTGLNYWSFGRYKQVLERIAQESDLISHIESVGIVEYLKEASPMSVETLKQKTEEFSQLPEYMGQLYSTACGMYISEQQRQLLSKLIPDRLLREGNIVSESIRYPMAETLDCCDPDFCAINGTKPGEVHEDNRRSMELLFSHCGNPIRIMIMPAAVEPDITNQVVIDLAPAPDRPLKLAQAQAREIEKLLSTILERLKPKVSCTIIDMKAPGVSVQSVQIDSEKSIVGLVSKHTKTQENLQGGRII